MTSSQILDEIHKQSNEFLAETGFIPQVLYISKEYVLILRTELDKYSPMISSPLDSKNMIMGLLFFTVIESNHINVTA